MPPRKRTGAALRRVPTQARSRARVEAILDAAAHIFADSSFEAATMDAIAERAGTSIGSVYQFFPNKLVLFHALAERCLERSQTAFDTFMSSELRRQPWPEVLEVVIDGYATLRESDPAFRAILVNFHLYGEFAEADLLLHRRFIQHVQQIVADHSPGIPPAQRKLIATMVVHTITAILFLAAREEPAFARKMIAETKVMLRRYLEPYARAEQAPPVSERPSRRARSA